VPCQLIRSAEALGAAWKLAHMRLLARVSANVSGLVFESVEGFGTDRTLVRSGQVLSWFFLLRRRILNGGSHQTDAGGGHGSGGW
jgi:hypothetical protein